MLKTTRYIGTSTEGVFNRTKSGYITGMNRETFDAYAREIAFRMHYRACRIRYELQSHDPDMSFCYLPSDDAIFTGAVNAFLVKLYATQGRKLCACCS